MSNLGPFYLKDAPALPLGADIAGGRSGVILLASGVVRDTHGTALPGAVVDTWQADGGGRYPIQQPGHDPMDLRARFTADAAGRYYYTTVLPKPYMVPDDGPVGGLLRAGNRHAWRSTHLHYMVSAPGMRTLTTELFFEGDEYIDSDAVFGVRRSLIGETSAVAPNADLEFALERRPTMRVDFDFVLAAQ
jgi:hydroxyquinol 1,2-dioxygenase